MVNAMLLNEFLNEHRKVNQLEKQVERLTAGLQKVSTQLELSKPAPQTVLKRSVKLFELLLLFENRPCARVFRFTLPAES